MGTNTDAKPSQIEVKAVLDKVETAETVLDREMRAGRDPSLPAPPLKAQEERAVAPRIVFRPHPDMICSDH